MEEASPGLAANRREARTDRAGAGAHDQAGTRSGDRRPVPELISPGSVR